MKKKKLISITHKQCTKLSNFKLNFYSNDECSFCPGSRRSFVAILFLSLFFGCFVYVAVVIYVQNIRFTFDLRFFFIFRTNLSLRYSNYFLLLAFVFCCSFFIRVFYFEIFIFDFPHTNTK